MNKASRQITFRATWKEKPREGSPVVTYTGLPSRRRVGGRGKAPSSMQSEKKKAEKAEKASVSGMERQPGTDKVRAGQGGLSTVGDTAREENASAPSP